VATKKRTLPFPHRLGTKLKTHADVRVALVPMTHKTLPLVINAKDYMTSKFVADDEGEIIYPMIRNALLQGRKVQLSVKDLQVNGGFFDTAICTLYGEFPPEIVDQIEVVDIKKVDTYGLKEIKEMRKYYYYDRVFYDKLISGLDPILGYNEPLYDFSDDEDDDSNEIKEDN
jgi:hypothetical protein